MWVEGLLTYLALKEAKSNVYDIMMHPDRGQYEIDFFMQQGGKASFELISPDQTQRIKLK
ncbi:hypothetical protein DMA11_21095 [Marinilabiliaceae bacterium JC017]|nr:hypothetical protein DMA11_21095 [Marinilabiliaceae bacterium JC017]